jgi:peroxiredoxin
MKKIFLFLVLLCIAAFNVHADVENGKPAPDFTLTDSKGQTHSLSAHKGKFIVLEWLNPDCPFVKKHYESGNMQGLQKNYTGKDVIWLSINSSATGKEGHYSPAQTNEWAEKEKINATAVLLDEDGKVGQMYGAKTTPHMFIIDPNGTLVYQGAIDSIKSADKADIAKAQNYVQLALDESMSGKPVSTSATKSYGCSVKY